MKLIGDIECDGLLYASSVVWCIVNYDPDKKHWYISVDHPIPNMVLPDSCTLMSHENMMQLMRRADTLVYHNGCGYDLPVLEKLHGLSADEMIKKTDDTMIMSSLYYPDRSFGHGLEAWGKQIGLHKGSHNEWHEFTQEMLDYCIQDVKVTTRVYDELQREVAGDGDRWKKSLKIENGVALIQARQELHGVLFDQELAYDTLAELDDEMSCIETKVRAVIHSKVEQVGVTVKAPFKIDGGIKTLVVNWYPELKTRVNFIGGPFTKVQFIPFNLNSSKQVKDYLLANGWKPTTWNVKGGGETKDPTHPERTSPKLTEDSYSSLDSPIPKLIARFNILKHRRNMICNIKDPLHKGWLANIRPDGRLEARAIPQATNTGRYRHSLVVNVPKASEKVVYGERMRSLFIAPEGKVFLGCDAKGLESRTEAHECFDFEGGREYAHELIDGDVHQKNADLFGTDRDGAKAPKYAMTYGAKPAKIAATLEVPFAEGKRLFDAFWNGNTALAGFRDYITKYWEDHGHIEGLDGRKIFIRMKHAIVNAKFQSDGSILVKVATLFFNKWIREEGLDAHQVIHMHDEFQYEIDPKDADRLTELAEKAFESAGKWLGMKVPTPGDVKIGRNWKETH